MSMNDLIDEKIRALLDYEGEKLDETYDQDIIYYSKMKDFAIINGGLLFFFDDNVYLIINFLGEKNFLFIPVEYQL